MAVWSVAWRSLVLSLDGGYADHSVRLEAVINTELPHSMLSRLPMEAPQVRELTGSSTR